MSFFEKIFMVSSCLHAKNQVKIIKKNQSLTLFIDDLLKEKLDLTLRKDRKMLNLSLKY